MSTPTRLVCLACAALLAGPIVAAIDPVNKDGRGIALHGYDPVAYFTDGRPVRGDRKLSHEWNGATWYFSTEEHRSLFRAEPQRYAPRYGGYCAKAVSENHTADIDPHAWRIVDGKLYLNYSPKVQRLWEQDIPGRVARADRFWPQLIAQ